MKNKISVIVPIYNVERFIRQCLDSIVDQTYKNLEIILIDDGSPDSCGVICDEYASIDDRITVIHKENAGVSAARNDGIERATGEWIMFVDPDDWMEPDCCEQVLRAANQANCDIIYFQRDENYENGNVAASFPGIDSRTLSRGELQRLQLDALADYVTTQGFESTAPWGKLYRRAFLMDHSCRFSVGIKRRQDVLFNLICLEYLDEAYYFDYVGYHYRRNKDSICRKYNLDMLDTLLEFYHKAEEFVAEYHGGDEKYERMLGVLAIKIHGDIRNTMFFNEAGFMPIKDYLFYMGKYYDDPFVKKYIKKACVSDFHGFRDKLSFVLLSEEHVYLYYYTRVLFKKMRVFIAKLPHRKAALEVITNT